MKQVFLPLLALLGSKPSTKDVLRLGRDSVQWWAAADARETKSARDTSLTLRASADFPADAWSLVSATATASEMPSWPTQVLTDLLAQIFARPPQGGIDVVLESTWLPVMLAPTGGLLVSEVQAVALTRHRLAQWYDSPSDSVALWDVRVSFNPGDALALGYGLSPQVSGALNQAASRLGFKIAALAPAWAWGWQRAQAQGCFARPAVWWGWQEQDRLLLGLVEGRGSAAQLRSLHPGLAWRDEPQHLEQAVRSEALRLGLVDAPRDACVGSWTSKGCRFIEHSSTIAS